jgi:ribosomal protein L16 Arg81 hydroxylase
MNDFNFQNLLSPISPRDFLSEYWEEKPLVLSRKSDEYYRNLFSIQDIDSVFLFSKPQPPDIRVVANQKECLPSSYLKPNGELNLNQLYKAYHEGHTLIVNGLQRFWQPLAAFCNQLQNYLNHNVVANMYFSPQQSKGLHPHYDTHDVFVLQVDGAKHWEIHQPTQPVPLLNTFQPVIPEKELGDPIYSVKLEPGDLLYIPRGFVHHAATQDTFSLHLTIGIYPHQWLDLIISAVTSLAMRDVRFRKALPVGFLDQPKQYEALGQNLQELIEILANRGNVGEALALLNDGQIRQTIPVATGQFAQMNRLDVITSESNLIRRSDLRCRVMDQLFSMSLQFPGNTITFPYSHKEALYTIAQSTQAFTVASLPELASEQQVQLARRLVRAGLLQII